MRRVLLSVATLALAGTFGLAQEAPEPSAALLDESKLQEIRLVIHPNDLQKLTVGYGDNTYYPATFMWRDQIVENVGIRSKGRSSRRPTKPGLRIDFNRYEEQTFLGLKAILLDNNITDQSGMRERLCTFLWQKMGLPAPRQTAAKLFVNDEYIGLYSLGEETDKTYLKRTFGEDTGYLYEYQPVQGYKFGYLGPDPEKYVPLPFEPKTHEKAPRAELIEEFIRAVNQTSDAEFPGAIEQYLDVKKFLTHLALENYLAEWDGIQNDIQTNNLFFYRPADSKKGMVLFKDKDLSFFSIDYPLAAGAAEQVLVRRLMHVPEWRAFWQSEVLRVAELAGGPDGELVQLIDKIRDQIRDALYADTRKECRAGACPVEQSNAEFDVQIGYLKDFVRLRPVEVRRQLGLETPATMSLVR